MSNLWYQFDQLDEIPGPSRDSPDGHIVWVGETPHLIDDNEEPGAVLEDGQAVKFMRVAGHGSATLTLTEDGFTVSRPMPEAADSAWEPGDHESYGETIEQVVEHLRTNREEAPGYTCEIEYYEQQHSEWRFDLSRRCFVAVEAMAGSA